MVNLSLGARPDEKFHLQSFEPYCKSFGLDDWLYRRVEWYQLMLPDGSPGWFTSYILLWFFRWYKGTVKCDATRTYMYRTGQLGDPYYDFKCVMTTTPKELFSFRLRWRKPNREIWTNMGGI